MTRDELKAKAKELGIEFKGNIKTDDLEDLVEQAEMEKKAAGYDKPLPKADTESATEGTTKADMRKSALKMVRCIVTPLDERMRTLPSEMYSTGNRKLGFIKKVVRFNVETLEPQIIIDLLQEKQSLIQQTNMVNGKLETKKTFSDAFNIRILPDFTEEEIKELMENK